MNESISKRAAVARMVSFLRPYGAAYAVGMAVYASQSFLFSYLSSLLLSWITAAMLSQDPVGVLRAGLLYAGFGIAYMLLLVVAIPLYVMNKEFATRDLKQKLFRCYIDTSLERAGHSGEGIAAINTQADRAVDLYGNPLMSVLSCLMSIVFSALVIFIVDVRMGLLSVGIGLLALLMQSRFAKPMEKIGAKRLEAREKSVKAISDMLSGAITLRAFSLEDRLLSSFDGVNQKLLRLAYRDAMISMLRDAFATLQGWVTMSGVFVIGGLLVASQRLDFASLMMIPTLSVALTQGLAQIGSAWVGIQEPIVAAQKIAATMEAGARIEAVKASKREGDPWNGEATLRMEDVSFCYASAREDALKHVSLAIQPNKLIAFVGASGSGKSTLLRVLAGFYAREGLRVSLGNLLMEQTPTDEWRKHFAYVDQSCKLFDMTIEENIKMGRPGADEVEVQKAAREAMADGFIASLPGGYQTQCGESGASLSGGQKQRIAIARALIRQAPVLVLDEATAALDRDSERQVMETVERLRHSHTILMTTHHLRNVTAADRIFVMDNGSIAQSGTHEELLAQGGVYARLWFIQEAPVEDSH